MALAREKGSGSWLTALPIKSLEYTLSGNGTVMECCISKCSRVWERDWEFFARRLGLTGPNGMYFCNYCHATIKDLQRGKSHKPWTLNSTFNGNHSKQFSPHTFESMSSDNKDFVNGSLVKAKANRVITVTPNQSSEHMDLSLSLCHACPSICLLVLESKH